jgi:hypothetical protein
MAVVRRMTEIGFGMKNFAQENMKLISANISGESL